MTSRQHIQSSPTRPPESASFIRIHDSESAPTVPTDLVPPPAVAGGLENIPEELLPETERVREELDHAGLDIALPGEDRAPVEAVDEHTDYPGAAVQPPQDG